MKENVIVVGKWWMCREDRIATFSLRSQAPKLSPTANTFSALLIVNNIKFLI